jgi:predicted enzyme related to lactoylglutathione lyase
MTSDPDRSRAFYGELFGWTIDDPGPEFGGYVSFLRDGIQVAGCMRNDGEQGAPDGWSVYLATADAAATVDAVVANGGSVLLAPMAVGELGTMAVVSDPGGGAVALWQPGLHPGFGLLAETGAPSWFELHTRAYDATLDFYRKVFGWETFVASDTPEFRYTTLGENEGALAGVMDAAAFLPDGVPARWSIYFGVDDTDAALARIGELGGAVVTPAQDSPYGRLAEAADPTGATFKLVAP